jgi:hypothetical protein
MKYRGALGVVIGVFLAISAFAHAFVGWPKLDAELSAAMVDPDLAGAIAAGWYFGSVAMFAFGAMVFLAGLRLRQGRAVSSGPIHIIGTAYVLFGAAAFIARDLSPHFLFFVFTGLLVEWFGFLIQGKTGQSQ